MVLCDGDIIDVLDLPERLREALDPVPFSSRPASSR